MINIFFKELMNKITLEQNSRGDIKINNTHQCNFPFSSIIRTEGHFCIGDYMFGMYHDDISICVAKMYYVSDYFAWSNGWFNLQAQMVVNDKTLWTPEYETIPICTTEEKHFQEMTRTDLKGLEVEDFEEILFFKNVVMGCIYECRKNSKQNETK